MEHLFDFVGSYWWLVFPLMPAFGAAAAGWQRATRRRHKRRLEILQAKTELRAAGARTVTTAHEPQPITRPSPVPDQLEKLFAAHDEVTRRWLEYELDVGKLIAFPAMSDGRQELTAAFLRAGKIAGGLRPATSSTKITPDQLEAYRGAVTDYELAFDLAERDARRRKDSSFSETERRRLATAKQLLTVAIDQAATPAERQLAYRRVRDELDGLLAIPDGAIVELEKKVALELPPASA